jgi:hypothetical protein
MKAMSRMSPPQAGHPSGKSSAIRAMSFASSVARCRVSGCGRRSGHPHSDPLPDGEGARARRRGPRPAGAGARSDRRLATSL